jgi:hypothetical protein
MNNFQLYTKLSGLPINLQYEVADFIDFLKFKSRKKDQNQTKRIPGKAKGLLELNENFDDPIDGFNEYMKST